MAYVPEERYRERGESRMSLAERLRELEIRQRLSDRNETTVHETKQFKFPFKWRFKFNQSKRKSKEDMILVIFLNKKNEIEPPKFMPIFDGNMIVWKNKPYEFDPRAVWRIKGIKGTPQTYLIKEIDRRPVRNKKGVIVYRDSAVSNMDLEEIRMRGDSTESDEFLIKAALKAQTTSVKKNVNMAIIVIIIVVIIGGLAWFMFGGGGAA